MSYELKIFSGNSNRTLSEKIATSLGKSLNKAYVSRFSDGEVRAKFEENIRGSDIFIIQSTQPPGDNWMELLIMLDAAKRASAGRITAVIPYFGYARQDRKDQPRVPITSRLCADLLETAGANRVLTMDLHSPQIQAFFDIPVDHLYSSMVLLDYYRSMEIEDLVVVGPDIGAVRLARAYAKQLHCPIAILDKRRPEPNKSEIIHVIGDVEGKNILILDDLIDTAGTLVAATEALINAGVKSVQAGCAHPVFSGKAMERINNSKLTKVTVSDTIPISDAGMSDKIEIVTVGGVFGKAIMRLHNGESISSLFDIFL